MPGDPRENSRKGREGEARAAEFLEKKGLTIIARNIRSRRGEADLAALDGQTVVFVEVKAWTALGIEALQYGLNREKQRRIIETAKYFLAAHREYKGMAVRFDVIFIGSPQEAPVHLESAFTETV
jgi:putative endonuclease